ncbi:MAG: carbohydrate porin [Pseudomonadota bacterium]|jgi:porin
MRALSASVVALTILCARPAFGQTDTPDPVLAPAPTAAPAPRPITFDGRYVLDLIGVAAGGEARQSGVLDNLELTADADLARLVGWHGAKARVHLLSNQGRAINDAAGTLQGIDNIEVADGRVKLYEAWIEQAFAGGRAALLVGLADLNADFYQNDGAAILMAPAFGVGSELAATGPNGPSIFPSTALMARLNVTIGTSGYARAAVVNARAGVLGDQYGVDLTMHDGALLIAEAGSTRGGKLAVGVWRYTRRQDDIRVVDVDGNPVHRAAMGAYLLVDQHIAGGDAHALSLFLRAGLSEGKTTPFRGGFQIGAHIRGVVPGRPEGRLSFGLAHGLLSSGYRANVADTGERAASAENGIEITYQDRLAPFLTIQPDLQYIRRACTEGGDRDTLVLGLRMIATFGRH